MQNRYLSLRRQARRAHRREASPVSPYRPASRRSRPEFIHTLLRIRKRLSLLAEIAQQLGATTRSKHKLLGGGFWLLLNDAGKTRFHFTSTLRKFNQRFDFQFEDFADFFTLWEVFVVDEYHLQLPREPRVILDLGSNIGLSILYFRLRYPQAKIYGVEPDYNNFRRLSAVVQPLTDAQAYQLAVADTDGRIPFYVDPHRGQSSSNVQRAARQRCMEVESRTLDTLIQELGLDQIDLIKFDIEGAEMQVFDSFSRLASVQYYIGEFHKDGQAWRPEDFVALFKASHHVTITEVGLDRYRIVASKR